MTSSQPESDSDGIGAGFVKRRRRRDAHEARRQRRLRAYDALLKLDHPTDSSPEPTASSVEWVDAIADQVVALNWDDLLIFLDALLAGMVQESLRVGLSSEGLTVEAAAAAFEAHHDDIREAALVTIAERLLASP